VQIATDQNHVFAINPPTSQFPSIFRSEVHSSFRYIDGVGVLRWTCPALAMGMTNPLQKGKQLAAMPGNVFLIGLDDTIWYNYWDLSVPKPKNASSRWTAWSGWLPFIGAGDTEQKKGKQLAALPGHVFLIDTDDAVLHSFSDPTIGNWTGWQPFGTGKGKQLAATPGNVFLIGMENKVWYNYWDISAPNQNQNSAWSGWLPFPNQNAQISGPTGTQLAALPGQVFLLSDFSLPGMGGVVFHSYFDNITGWTPWEPFPNSNSLFLGKQIAAMDSSAGLDRIVLLIGLDNKVYYSCQNWLGAFTSWQPIRPDIPIFASDLATVSGTREIPGVSGSREIPGTLACIRPNTVIEISPRSGRKPPVRTIRDLVSFAIPSLPGAEGRWTTRLWRIIDWEFCVNTDADILAGGLPEDRGPEPEPFRFPPFDSCAAILGNGANLDVTARYDTVTGLLTVTVKFKTELSSTQRDQLTTIGGLTLTISIEPGDHGIGTVYLDARKTSDTVIISLGEIPSEIKVALDKIGACSKVVIVEVYNPCTLETV
jgi:hypothetical protein